MGHVAQTGTSFELDEYISQKPVTLSWPPWSSISPGPTPDTDNTPPKAIMSAVFTCTACAITFEDLDSLKKHYKSDWHRYNLRRKVAGLEPVDQQDFDRRLAVALGSSAPRVDVQQRCEVCRKNLRSEGL